MACEIDREGLDRTPAMMEMLTAIKRAGSDILITYFAKEVAQLLQG